MAPRAILLELLFTFAGCPRSRVFLHRLLWGSLWVLWLYLRSGERRKGCNYTQRGNHGSAEFTIDRSYLHLLLHVGNRNLYTMPVCHTLRFPVEANWRE